MNRALKFSLVIHLTVAVLFLILAMPKSQITVEDKFEFELIEKDIIKIKKPPKIVVNAKKDIKSKAAPKKPVREVFGGKRKTLTSTDGTAKAKIGNTLTKAEDDKVLRDNEDDSLRAPADEFLITSMPRALKEVRPKYPKWAKEQKITGTVIFEIVIDEKGRVRRIKLLKSLHPELDKLAHEALLKFEFKPAYVEKEPAVAKINYAIRYTLED